MGKGTKKKTVWRTFSFENGYTNGNDAADTTANGHTALHHQKNDVVNSHEISNRSSISNGKFAASWRSQRYSNDDVAHDNDTCTDSKVIDANGNVNGCTENGHHSYVKRSPFTDNNKYSLRGNGLRKAPPYFQDNGNKSDFHDIYENSTKLSQYRSNRVSKVQPASRHANYKKWDSRNGNYNSNGILNNYSRGNRKSHYAHSDQVAATATSTAPVNSHENNFVNCSDEHFHENGLANKARNSDDSDKCQDKANDGSSAQLLHGQADQHRNQQRNKFNEDEYTRISTPRSEVLFKKGYLMRDKKYVGPTNTISTTATSSNDSGSVSVVSNEETASYYSIQSMSPDNSTYLNGNNSSESTSATYPTDGFEHDLSLIYSSGFYDNSGYFYVNPYIHNNFDQFNGPTILMPYGSAPTSKDIDAYDADAYSQAPLSPATGDEKSIDGEHTNNFNSVNSEEMSNSSLSENISINNDTDTPPNPLTPPPSPLSPNEKPIARAEVTETQPLNEDKPLENDSSMNDQNDSQTTAQGEQIVSESAVDEQQEQPESTDAVVPDNFSMPYFSPLIFVPPIPFVSDARMGSSRRGKFRRHLSNQFGRPKRNNRFSHFYNKVYIPSNWSEAPDEATPNDVNEDDVVESENGNGKSTDTEPAPTIEQCDTILKNSKLNLNVSEFIPQSKRMIFVPVPITPSPPAPVYFVSIPSTESTLNVNVPEFLPKNYKPWNGSVEESDGCLKSTNNENNEPTPTMRIDGQNSNEVTIKTNEIAENQNETTNNYRNGSSNDVQCTENPLNTDALPTTAATDVADATTTPTTTKSSTNEKVQPSQSVANHEPDTVAVSIMSDLLKNNSDNLNLDARSFNNENSHTNLKADLGSKKVTNNISKNTVYKNDNYCNDSDSSKSHKVNSSNKHAKARHAYPKTKETSQPNANVCDASLSSSNNNNNNNNNTKHDQRTTNSKDDRQNVADICSNDNAKSVEKLNEKPGLTYAQMVVPAKIMAPTTNTIEVKATSEISKLPKSPAKGKNTQNASINGNNNRKSNSMKKKLVASDSRNERVAKVVDGSVEWFTIGAKGKKHVTPNSSTVTEIAFENESNVEKVNKIAEELQLDINKDADLAMDIMDSLAIAEEKSEEKSALREAPKKQKKTLPNANKAKKKPKEKANREPKNRHTFDIIEPNFEAQKSDAISIGDDESENSDGHVETVTQNDDINTIMQSDQSLDEFVFDPNVFATPCNLQMDSPRPQSTATKLGKSLRLSTGKPVRNLINQFDIYQQDFTSIENQQLKQEEEMVIKVLQQLNKSIDEKDESFKNEVTKMVADLQISSDLPEVEIIKEMTPTRENSVERFAINAKPYQNVYASNHFLERFFGDRNDKCDHVESSTDLSSSDQSNVETAIDEHLNTYPAIATDHDEDLSGHDYNHNENPVIDTQSKIDDEIKFEKSLERESTVEIVFENEIKAAVEIEIEENFQITNEIELEKEIETEQTSAAEDENLIDAKIEPSVEIEILNDENPNIEHVEELPTLVKETIESEMIGFDAEVEKSVESTIEIIQTEPETTSDEKLMNEANMKTEAFEINDDEAPTNDILIISETADEVPSVPEHCCNNDDEQSIVCEMAKPDIQIEVRQPESIEQFDEEKDKIASEIEPEPFSIGTDASSNEIEPVSSVSCNQSIKSNSSNGRPWLRIVDTQMLQHEKKLQQTFPITSAVSMWLQAQKEKTPEPVLRMPDYRFFAATSKHTKTDSQASHSNSSIDLTEDTASMTSDRFHINDDEEEDIMNFYESPMLLSPQSPTPPPVYNSVYGTSINYTNLLSNKNELLCNNILEYDQIDAANGKMSDQVTEQSAQNLNLNGFNQNGDATAAKTGADEKCSYRPPPEVCCTIM